MITVPQRIDAIGSGRASISEPIPSGVMAVSTESTAHELATIADNIGQYRSRVAALAERHVGTERDDFVAAIHEAERQIRSAERGLVRAVKAAG